VAVDRTLLEKYRQATEALLDALTVFQSRNHIRHGAEHQRLEQLIEKSESELDRVRREYQGQRYERPDDLKQSG
jgi:hypothetical protein